MLLFSDILFWQFLSSGYVNLCLLIQHNTQLFPVNKCLKWIYLKWLCCKSHSVLLLFECSGCPETRVLHKSFSSRLVSLEPCWHQLHPIKHVTKTLFHITSVHGGGFSFICGSRPFLYLFCFWIMQQTGNTSKWCNIKIRDNNRGASK